MSFLDQIHKNYRITADWEQDHAKLYKENHWYKAWYDTMTDGHKLKNKLTDIASSIRIQLEDYEQLPEGCDKDWDGYVLVLENSVKRLLKLSQEAEQLVKTIKDKK